MEGRNNITRWTSWVNVRNAEKFLTLTQYIRYTAARSAERDTEKFTEDLNVRRLRLTAQNVAEQWQQNLKTETKEAAFVVYSVKEDIGGIRHLKILIHLQISIQSANTRHMKEEPLNKERFFEYLT